MQRYNTKQKRAAWMIATQYDSASIQYMSGSKLVFSLCMALMALQTKAGGSLLLAYLMIKGALSRNNAIKRKSQLKQTTAWLSICLALNDCNKMIATKQNKTKAGGRLLLAARAVL